MPDLEIKVTWLPLSNVVTMEASLAAAIRTFKPPTAVATTPAALPLSAALAVIGLQNSPNKTTAEKTAAIIRFILSPQKFTISAYMLRNYNIIVTF
jgi:hypothetical protein